MAQPAKFTIVRKSDHQRTAYDAVTLVEGLKHAARLAREAHKSYAVAYIGSLAPIVTVNSRGQLNWH